MGLPVGPKTMTTRGDLALASIFWGFTLGFGFLVVWGAIKQTMRAKSPWRSIFIILVWGEILTNTIFGIISYLFLTEVLVASFPVLLTIVFVWSLELQFLLQIIINRINVILPDRRKQNLLKWGVGMIWLVINISGFCIWIPARMGVSHRFVSINYIWDRTEKSLYLLADCGLNWWFMRLVRQRLVKQGSSKYNKLVKFNMRIIIVSLLMDVLLIGTMNLKNDLVYLQVHPLSFIVKLNIEMTMATLIRKISKEKNEMPPSAYDTNTYKMTVTAGNPDDDAEPRADGEIMVRKQVIVERQMADDGSVQSTGDESPLRDDTWTRTTYNTHVPDTKTA